MSIDHIVLGLISLNPCSGYDMKLEFEQGGAGMLSALSFGSIYPRLKQLEQDGLIVTVQASESGRRKKVYELTASGWQELSAWLEQSTAYPIPMRADLLRYIDAWKTNGKSFVDEYTELVLNYIQVKLEAELSWIDATIPQLGSPASLPLQDPRWLSVL